jgi:hypothetical protein
MSRRRSTWLLWVPLLLLFGQASFTSCTGEADLSGTTARASYSLGHQIGSDLRGQGELLDRGALVRGLRQGLAGDEPELSRDEMRGVLVALKRDIQARQRARQRALALGQAEPGGEPAPAPETPEGSGQASQVAYSIGFQVGGDFRRQGFEIEPEIVARGAGDAVEGRDPALSADEMRQALTQLQRRAETAASERREAVD